MENIIEYLEQLNFVSITLRLMLSMIVGGALGIERVKKRRPAGMRTYMIVCMASALVMITGQYIADVYGNADRARLGAQVISGIGFLGAGTIIVTHRQVTGLTTAAGLWASACIGLAFGTGFYIGGILCGLLVFLTMTALDHVSQRLQKDSKNMMLFAEIRSMSTLTRLLHSLRENEYKILNLEIGEANAALDEYIGVFFWIEHANNFDHAQLMANLSLIKGVKFIEELDSNQ